MGRLNDVQLFGIVADVPVIIKKGSEYISAKVYVNTARRSYMNERMNLAGAVRMDMLIVRTENLFYMQKIEKLREGDVVDILGTLSTKDIPKRLARCPECGQLSEFAAGVEVYVDPYEITQWPIHMEENEAIKFVLEHANRSNRAKCFCTILETPRYAPQHGSKKKQLDCHVAINRKRYIVEDGPDKRADFPYVRMYGKMAEECSKVLSPMSEIYVDGAIEVRDTEQERLCQHCGCDFVIPHAVMEIVPYSVEYTENCDIDALRPGEDEEPLITNNVERQQEYYERKQNREWLDPDEEDEISTERKKAPEPPKETKKRGRPKKMPSAPAKSEPKEQKQPDMSKYASLYNLPFYAIPNTTDAPEGTELEDNFWTSEDPSIEEERKRILAEIKEYEQGLAKDDDDEE